MNKLSWKTKNVWEKGDEYTKKAFSLAEEYKKFMDKCKTEREAVEWTKKEIEKIGFLKEGNEKFYIVNREKCIAVVKLGKGEGMKLIAAHIDSPRIDLKQKPLYEDKDTQLALLHTHYYGGIKKYQWMNIPLAIHGKIVKKSGEILNINIGEDDNDPLFVVPDLLPHLAKKEQYEKKMDEAFSAEKLNPLIGSMPDLSEKEEKVKAHILHLLHEKYGISEEDFVSAELELVPAWKSRDAGIDKSFIAAYGQDDKICAFTAFKALMESDNKKTCMVLLIDKEEIGSDGATGMKSHFFLRPVIEILKRKEEKADMDNIIQFLEKSECLSADVNGAVNPLYKDVHEMDNASYINKGIVLTKYTGHRGKYEASDASAEFLGKLRNIFSQNDVLWQIGELGKVDEGGGGTIAKYIAQWNVEVVDCGPAILSMHSPYEISSKGDLYETFKAYKAFFESE